MSINERCRGPVVSFLSLFVLALTAVAGVASAQTADEVIEKHLAATGGRAALGKLTSRHATGTLSVSAQGAEIPGTVEIFAKKPNKVRVAMKLDLSAMGGSDMAIEQRFDGTAGYSLNSMQGDTEITGNQLDNLRNSSFPTPLLNYKDMGMKVELLPKQQVNGKDAIVLLMTPKAGSAVRTFLDPETYLVIRSVSLVDSPQGGDQIEQTSDLSDYRTVDDVKVAHRVVLTSPVQNVTLTFKTIEHNVPIDDAMFAKK